MSLPDTLPFRRLLIAAIGIVVAICAGVVLSDNPFAVVAALVGLAYVFTAGVNYRWLAIAMVALAPAALIVPFFPGRPFMWEVCAMLAWPSLVVAVLINRQRFETLSFDRRETYALLSLAGYVAVVVVLMLSRGVGFRVLGGGQMGGRFYVQQVLLAIVPLLLLLARPSPRALLGAVIAGWILSLTYLVSDFALAWGGPRFYSVLQFFELPTDAINFFVGYELTGVRRYQSLWFVGSAITSALCVAMPLKDVLGKKIVIGVPVLLAALALGLGSGHRTALIESALTLGFLAWFQRFWTPVRAIFAGASLLVAIAALYLAAPVLPVAIQRSISFLPGIDVSAQAKDDAEATVRDRVEVLKLAWNDLPKYWLVGRGFGMERFDEFEPDKFSNGIYEQYENGLFYNGLLGSILKTGVPGFLCSALFIFWISRIALQLVSRIREQDSSEWSALERLGLLVSAQWFCLVVFFYFLHGDAGYWVQTFGLTAALILVCRREVEELAPVDPASSPA